MPTASSANRTAKTKTVSFWVLKIVLGLMFVGGAVFKLTGAEAAVTEFDLVGLGQVVPLLHGGMRDHWRQSCWSGRVRRPMAPFLLAAVCVGAFVAQLEMLHGDVIHTIVLAAILGAIAWANRDQVLVGLAQAGIPILIQEWLL